MLINIVPAVLAGLAALSVFAGWPRSRSRIAWATGIAAAASLLVTAAHPAGATGPTPGTLGTLEAIALLTLIVPAVRYAPIPQAIAAGLSAHLAVTLWVLRAWSTELGGSVVGGCVFWSLMATSVAAGGTYLRVLDERRTRSVAEGRRRQRLDLARDLHDFVAHDVSEMVAQAQAGRFVGEHDPGLALAALRRIEAAGLRALAAMDRTVHMLHDEDGDSRQAAHGLAELSELVERFDHSSSARVRLDLPPRTVEDVPREVSTTVYRIVVEALTNVRRHAPDAEVAVMVRTSASTLPPASTMTVTVKNGPSTRRPSNRADRRGGLGLPGLAERVESLGGTLTAGPCDDGGWQLTAELPLAPTATPAR
ncbi:histidine kinase [Streptomyces sp. NPDC055692]|uniref:sensor histidine kinase n=1 Tax=Streptomyces sp. NPDC055692 TaxID=3155683 RepID=UPI003440319F